MRLPGIVRDPPGQEREGSLHLFDLLFGVPRPRFLLWESLTRQLVNDFLYATRALTYQPAYRDVWQHLRQFPDFRRLAAVSIPRPTPSPFLTLSLRHSQLGLLILRTAPTVFTWMKDSCIISYLPDNQQT